MAENKDINSSLPIKKQPWVFNHSPWQLFPGSVLKWIALVTMIIDHTAMVLVDREQYAWEYAVMRSIGRLAFPIYCFLLIEGFLHTRNIGKYAASLAVFALLSEIPYDLARNNMLYNPEKQNIFFTLLLGLIMMYCMKMKDNALEWQLIFCMGACGIAEICNVDYGMRGILQIAGIYFCRYSPFLRAIFIVLMNVFQGGLQIFGGLAAIPVSCYNGQRGRQLKYIFYLAYPVHLLLLYFFNYIYFHLYTAP